MWERNNFGVRLRKQPNARPGMQAFPSGILSAFSRLTFGHPGRAASGAAYTGHPCRVCCVYRQQAQHRPYTNRAVERGLSPAEKQCDRNETEMTSLPPFPARWVCAVCYFFDTCSDVPKAIQPKSSRALLPVALRRSPMKNSAVVPPPSRLMASFAPFSSILSASQLR